MVGPGPEVDRYLLRAPAAQPAITVADDLRRVAVEQLGALQVMAGVATEQVLRRRTARAVAGAVHQVAPAGPLCGLFGLWHERGVVEEQQIPALQGPATGQHPRHLARRRWGGDPSAGQAVRALGVAGGASDDQEQRMATELARAFEKILPVSHP